MRYPRESGILLHPTSLPGAYGMGEIGPQARKFVDDLEEMGQHLWQVLPLGPTSYGDSPYQSPSTFAGNHLLISFEQLVKDKLLSPRRLSEFPEFDETAIDYGAVIAARLAVLKTVCRTFDRRTSARKKKAFHTFCRKQAYWLDDYAVFMAIKEAQGGGSWIEWPEDLAVREPRALQRAERSSATAIRYTKILQFLFHEQWTSLMAYCHKKGVRVMGDIPIFVAHDSADVWAHPELFFVNGHGTLIVQAGVPPDYFSETGQLWGNPLYRWDIHQHSDYAWWASRMKKIFEMVDVVRIDHFRGFEAYWEVPAHYKTAMDGRWVKGPAYDVFDALIRHLGPLPIIAEDLGVITPEVEALRDKCHFPGMRILQFAFGTDPKAEDYRPHNYPQNCVVYTGTHDNDTTVGWFHSKAGNGTTRSQEDIDREKQTILDYVQTDGSHIHWDMISLAMHSKADTAVVPMQDMMGLGSEARMNTPGKCSGNWQWRFTWDMLTPTRKSRMRELAVSSKRSH